MWHLQGLCDRVAQALSMRSFHRIAVDKNDVIAELCNLSGDQTDSVP